MKLVQVVGFGVLSQTDKSHLTVLLVRLYWIHAIWKEARGGREGNLNRKELKTLSSPILF